MRRGMAVAALLAMLLGFVVAVPAAQGEREARLVAAGDFGARAATRTVLDGMAAASPTAAVAVGDLKYRDVATEYEWCDYVKQSVGEGFPFQLVAGNHESLDVSDGLINNFSACLPNQIPGVSGTYGREYVMDFPRANPLVRVIGISPGLTFEDGRWDYAVGDAHYNWLGNAIDSGRAAGAQYIVVAAHLPCWSIGTYSCKTDAVSQLLLSKRVDLVLHGHEHGYMRTHQLANGVAGCATVPTNSYDADCVADRDGTYQAGAGTVFATVGTGGIDLRNVNLGDSEAGYFASSSGANRSPAHGFLDIAATEEALSVRFVTTSGGPFSDAFTISTAAPPSDALPEAAFTATVDGPDVAVDGRGSSDDEGPIASYRWDFGDGSPEATGATASHTYPAAGDYTITLTVTDGAGQTASTTRSVAVAGPPPPVGILARDAFERTLATGFGAADIGGDWALSGGISSYSVDGSHGVIALNPGNGRQALLPEVSATDTDAMLAFSYSGQPTGSGVYVNVMPRVRPDSSGYRAKVRIDGSGTARLSIARVAPNGSNTTIASSPVPLTGASAGRTILVRARAVGSSPTTVAARLWFAGDPEPTDWQVQTTDAGAAQQGGGGVGVFGYLSGGANSPVDVRLDEVAVTEP